MVIMIGQPALTREQMQAFDRWAIEELGVPGVVLMENAGRGCAEVLLRVHAASGEPSLPQSDSASDTPAPTAVLSRLEDFALGRYPRPHRVAVCCGRGNNGGDGYVLGRYLALLGIGVQVLAFADPEQLSGEARWAAELYCRLRLPLVPFWNGPLDETRLRTELAHADWVADALFGTGLKGPLRPPFDRVVELINASGKPILAVDIPSGLDCNTGLASGPAIRARCTATMAACKRGFLQPTAREFTGDVYVVSLGVPVSAWPGLSQAQPTSC
jgi:hydroxyethylthiazole kinase-like uncharacterized protein yjeF